MKDLPLCTLASGASAGVTWVQAQAGQLAMFGADAVIWIPIIIQIVSLITAALESRNKAKKAKRTPPVDDK